MSDPGMCLHDMSVADLIVPCIEILGEKDPDKAQAERDQRDQTA
jgi:hypothetical protein